MSTKQRHPLHRSSECSSSSVQLNCTANMAPRFKRTGLNGRQATSSRELRWEAEAPKTSPSSCCRGGVTDAQQSNAKRREDEAKAQEQKEARQRREKKKLEESRAARPRYVAKVEKRERGRREKEEAKQKAGKKAPVAPVEHEEEDEDHKGPLTRVRQSKKNADAATKPTKTTSKAHQSIKKLSSKLDAARNEEPSDEFATRDEEYGYYKELVELHDDVEMEGDIYQEVKEFLAQAGNKLNEIVNKESGYDRSALSKDDDEEELVPPLTKKRASRKRKSSDDDAAVEEAGKRPGKKTSR